MAELNRATTQRSEISEKPGVFRPGFQFDELAMGGGLCRFVRHSGIVAVGIRIAVSLGSGFRLGFGTAARTLG
jgi:hypothetical protein